MRIAILGIGRMGSWLARDLAGEQEVAIFDVNPSQLTPFSSAKILRDLSQLKDFKPQMLINAVSLQHTIQSFQAATPYLPAECILCDLATIKGDLAQYYRTSGLRFVSLHPMFGPTFANVDHLQNENAVLITESDPEGMSFFRSFFLRLKVNLYEFSFEAHDRMMAYSLSLPSILSLLFAGCVDTRAVPGTTFRKHLEVARGLLSEDDHLLAEIIFNPHALAKLALVTERLDYVRHLIMERNFQEAQLFFTQLRQSLE